MDSRAPATTTAFASVEDSIVNIELYRDGRRVASPPTVADAQRSLLAEQGTMAWIGLYRPGEA
jgi:magnesium transporter